MNLVKIIVRLGQLLSPPQQAPKAVIRTQFKSGIHFDRVERAHFNTDLAAHTYRNIDVENSRVKLRFAQIIWLLVFALFNEDALRRALFFTNLARHTSQALLPVVAVIDEERKVPRRLRLRQPFLRKLNGGQPVLADVAAKEILSRLRQPLQDTFTKHGSKPSRSQSNCPTR